MVKAVFFDVDFTLITPGPTFRAEGYRAFCERHGMVVDESKFAQAVIDAAPLLDSPEELPYHDDIYIRYTRRIVEGMGGWGPTLDACAREIYAEWAACQHFNLYDEVPAVLNQLAAAGLRIGLISNSHRCLASFQEHFELHGLIAGAISSSEHGLMKPHSSIFNAALNLVDVRAADALMVGDSIRQDVEGALRAGMHAVLLHRGSAAHPLAEDLRARGVPVIRTLSELPAMLRQAPIA